MTLRGHDEGIITSVAFSPDGNQIVSSSQHDATARVWDVTTGTELITLKHADGVTSAAFSPDGKRVISGSHDRTVRVWDAVTGAELLTLRAGFVVDAVTFSPDGKTIASGPFDHTITLWESTPPAGGYGRRKHGEAARKIVDELHEIHSYHKVISQLQQDTMLGPAVRKLALQIANSRKWEDAERLKREAWKIVIFANKNNEEYQAALEKVKRAHGWEPNDPVILNTLGAAQYRLGSYVDALKTLARSAQILSDAGEEPDPLNTAFTAMTLYRMGRIDEAKSALERLRALCKDEFAGDVEALNLLPEVEKLISGEKQ